MAVELAELIGQLRAELERARAMAEGAALRFELGPVDLEVTVAVEKEGKAGARVRFWVAEMGADGTASSTSTQRIKLTLTPSLVDARPEPGTPASPVSVYIHGAAVPGER